MPYYAIALSTAPAGFQVLPDTGKRVVSWLLLLPILDAYEMVIASEK